MGMSSENLVLIREAKNVFLSYNNELLKLDKIQYLQAKFHIIFELLETEAKIMM